MKSLFGGGAIALRLALVAPALALLVLAASEDGAAQQGSVSITVNETVGVSDSQQSLPPASSEISEAVLIGDSALVLGPAEIVVAESIDVFDTVADSDGDGVLDLTDNCQLWPNPSQARPNYGPLLGTGPDSDCDNFTDSREAYLGTNPLLHCAADTTGNNEDPPDRWPFDMNDNRIANTVDVGQFVFSLNSRDDQTPPDPRWNQRHDFNGNGIINTIDVGAYVFVLNKTCSPSGP